jgi:predicted metal-dependent hydrolase
LIVHKKHQNRAIIQKVKSQMNWIVQSHKSIEKCLSIRFVIIDENSQHVSHLIIAISIKWFFYWTNLIVIVVNRDRKEEEVWINDILDNRYHYEKLQYRIAWTDHSSNRAWYSAENFLNHSKEILDDYHRRYFTKFELDLRLIAIIETMLSQWIKNEHKKAKQLIQDVLNRMKAKMKENDRKRFSKETKVCLNVVKELRLI